MNKVRILLYDLEISPMLCYAYEMWNTNIIKVEKQPEIMSISWKWLGDKKVENINQTDLTEEHMIKRLWSLLDEAQVVVAHNASRFDNKVSNAMFIRQGMTPPSPYRTIDTLTVARSKFKFNSNSLDNLGELLGIGRKTNDKHSDLWYDCLKGDKKAWKKMAKYNDNDVVLLEKLYLKLRPYISNHPNIAILANDEFVCPKCGGKHLNARGVRHTNAGAMQRYRCMDCGGWCAERMKDEEIERSAYVSY